VLPQIGIERRRSLLAGVCWLLTLAASCSRTDPATGVSANSSQTAIGQAVLVTEPDPRWPSDPLTVTSAAVVGDSLVVAVEHGGGCATHDYQLVVSRSWMESFPVQVPARLSHGAHGDACKALIRRELRFSLLPVADAYRASYQQAHGSVSIRLAGSTAALLYTF
jgi:hypothetical protein